jgi:GNAT superfamily N-acetyltransferase
MPVVKKITALETYTVRQEVLRKGKPIETCHFIGDDASTTTHFGLFEDETIIGVVSVYKANSPLFSEKTQFQIRGMAVLENFQSKGYGEQLLKTAENFCWEEKANLIWFNAREKAVSFYQKSGYKIVGDSFDIPNVGIHFVMFKKN